MPKWPSLPNAVAVLCTVVLLLYPASRSTFASESFHSTSSVPLDPTTTLRVSLRHIFRAGFKTDSILSSKTAPSVPWMERMDIDDSMTSSDHWVADPSFDAAADAGVPFGSRGARPPPSMSRPGPLPFGDGFDVQGIRGKIPKWSALSKAALSAEGRRQESGQHPMLVPEEDFEGQSEFVQLGVDGEIVKLVHKDVLVPDHTDNRTVLVFGQMAYNAYYEPESKEWIQIPGWETSDGFGSTGDAIRGHVFASPSNDIVIIVIKGTSLQAPFSSGPTSANDKLNDNKMFSCCCGKAGWTWTPVCKCANSAATRCDLKCVEQESDFKESYYRLATSIAHTVQQIFPRSALWVTGHSLGGALASLVALTFDLPAFTFEAPGDLLFAKRLGLLPPAPPQVPQPGVPGDETKHAKGLEEWEPYLETLPIFQFGNDGDPVYLGQCRSVTSSCWFGGYALETRCHVGRECVYDSDLDGKTPPPGNSPIDGLPGPINDDEDEDDDWLTVAHEEVASELRSSPGNPRTLKSVSINNHGIKFVIDRYLAWWDYVPQCRVNSNYEKCNDCESWEFY